MSSDNDNSVLFSRSNGTGELRGDCPKEILAVLDAVAMARHGAGRMTIVNEILGEWAKNKIHESTLIQRLTKDYPTSADGGGKGAE